ncbi:unnamed protein product [Dicrocoelium dendriticum]|nr:unnamed protein product [Dicrocoelium dendriticum]
MGEREVDLDIEMVMEDRESGGHSISDDAVDVQDGYVCFCGAAFGSKRGLGQHKRHRHPVELNEERLRLVPRRREWSEREASRLLALANQFLPECENKVEAYRRLSAQFPGRSVEGIK